MASNTATPIRTAAAPIGRALRFCDANRNAFVEDLAKLVAVPSVSFPGFPPEALTESARAVAELLKRRGLENVAILQPDGAHPYVYADWLHAPGKPTLLLYAHHDVQPAGREEIWKSPPFQAVERGGRLYGRGAADDKAGVVVHSSAVAAWLAAAGGLPLNIKVLIEGEEEIGSEHLEALLKRHSAKVRADAIVLADTGNYDVGLPSITATLRGIVSLDLEVRSMDHPLHSGMWGGPLPDPVLAAAKMLASLADKEGRIAVAGIYKEVRPLSAADKRMLKSLGCAQGKLREQAGLLPGTKLVGGKAGLLEKNWRLPSVSVNAIQASSRKDVANVINESVWCRVGIRIVPDMDPRRTLELLKGHLKKRAPWGVEVRFSDEYASPWWTTDVSGPVFGAARRALAKGYGREAVVTGCGGSIPFTGPLSEALGGAPALLIGVEDPYSNPHSENESLHLGDFHKAIRSAVHLYQEVAALERLR